MDYQNFSATNSANAPAGAASHPSSNQSAAAAPDLTSTPLLAVMLQQERLMQHMGSLISQSEASVRAEREQERAERRSQHEQLTQAFGELTDAVRGSGEANGGLRQHMEVLESEVRTLRAAILLAHQIGREENSQSPLGTDVARGNPFELFPVPPSSPAQAYSQATMPARDINAYRSEEYGRAPVKQRKKKVMSPEARARISATQKERWAARRAAMSAVNGNAGGGEEDGGEDGDA